MDAELAGLEHKRAALLAEYHRLRAENESLKRELARAQEQSRAMSEKMAAASSRLDSLLQRLPKPRARHRWMIPPPCSTFRSSGENIGSPARNRSATNSCGRCNTSTGACARFAMAARSQGPSASR